MSFVRVAYLSHCKTFNVALSPVCRYFIYFSKVSLCTFSSDQLPIILVSYYVKNQMSLYLESLKKNVTLVNVFSNPEVVFMVLVISVIVQCFVLPANKSLRRKK